MRVDAHVHLWDPARGDYGWLEGAPEVLRRPYGPEDLGPLLAAHGIDAVVLVQAAPTVAETEYLLALADGFAPARAVVGWIDFEGDAAADLARLAHPKLRGVRPMVQDIPDDDWVLRPAFAPVFERLAERGLVFDALGFPRHASRFAAIAARHPQLTMVVDHAMKPGAGRLDRWAEDMTALARCPNTVCKLSGLVTELGPDWSVDALRPVAAHLFAAFGPERLMFGSDWPVVLSAPATYEGWLSAAEALTADLTAADRDAIFGGTAARIYGL